MKEAYIKRVKRELSGPRSQRREVVRDLEEVFASALEHGETEQAVIERLGPPETFAAGVAEQLGQKRRPRRGMIAAAVAAVLAVVLLGIFAVSRLLRTPVGVIGQADARTGIQVVGAFDGSLLLLGLGVIAAVAAGILFIRCLRRRGGKK